MSTFIYQYFKKKDDQLPDPTASSSRSLPSADIVSANAEVGRRLLCPKANAQHVHTRVELLHGPKYRRDLFLAVWCNMFNPFYPLIHVSCLFCCLQVLNEYFHNVCELDLVFNFYKVNKSLLQGPYRSFIRY